MFYHLSNRPIHRGDINSQWVGAGGTKNPGHHPYAPPYKRLYFKASLPKTGDFSPLCSYERPKGTKLLVYDLCPASWATTEMLMKTQVFIRGTTKISVVFLGIASETDFQQNVSTERSSQKKTRGNWIKMGLQGEVQLRRID